MRHFARIFIAATFLILLMPNENADGEEPALIAFDSLTYTFGEVESGTIVSHDFKFTNKGGAPLIISNVNTGYGFADFSKEPIVSGASGKITLRLSTAGKVGPIEKTADVISNSSGGTVKLRMVGSARRSGYTPVKKDSV
jgi:hypothetical protein